MIDCLYSNLNLLCLVICIALNSSVGLFKNCFEVLVSSFVALCFNCADFNSFLS